MDRRGYAGAAKAASPVYSRKHSQCNTLKNSLITATGTATGAAAEAEKGHRA